MRNLKRIIAVVPLLVVAVLVLSFVLENRQAVSLTWMGWTTPQLPVALYIVLALVLGLLIGPLMGMFWSWRGQARNRRKKRRLQAAMAAQSVQQSSP